MWKNRDTIPSSQLGFQLPHKVFQTRESYLTVLFEDEHITSIYHIFISALILLLAYTLCHMEESIPFGLQTVAASLTGIQLVAAACTLMHSGAFVLYFASKCWINVHHKLQSHNFNVIRLIWDYFCVVTFAAFQFFYGYCGSILCLNHQLPFVSACILLVQTYKILMKTYAFIRTNVPIALVTNSIDDTFSNFVYFLFAPTFIYQKTYPRTETIRWNFVIARLIEVIAIYMQSCCIVEQIVSVQFIRFCTTGDKILIAELNERFFNMIIPSLCLILLGFYAINHSWMNFTAELLRFGDRMFYKDWWTTSTTFSRFFRTWNVIVHDWLYEYVYKDCYTHIFKGSKVLATAVTFLASAVIHELILSFSLQFFYPVCSVFMIASMILGFVWINLPKHLGNVIFWISYAIGNCLLFSIIFIEYFARRNNNCNLKMSIALESVTWKCLRGSQLNCT